MSDVLQSPESSPQRRQARILVADDNEAVRKCLKNLLSDCPAWVVCGEAADGQQAVSLAQKLNPDLIILDVGMPILDGLHAALEILKDRPSVPIILFTLYKSDPLDFEAKKMGVRAVVSKASGTEALLETVQTSLAPKATQALSAPAF
jgi:DNA-binding NarL/FixJ family response regulator